MMKVVSAFCFDANLQICINKKMDGLSMPDIAKWCKSAITAYRNWLFPFQNASTPETLSLMLAINGVKYEQMPSEGRAIGLWMWDLVKMEGETAQKVLEIIQKPHKNNIRSASTNLRQFQRDLYLADACIKHMQVLSGAKKIPPDGPSGLLAP